MVVQRRRRTALLADAFAPGSSQGVVPTMKHFPGSGSRPGTPTRPWSRSRPRRRALAPGLRPYRTAIGHRIPLIMLSNATYPAYDAPQRGRLVARDRGDTAPRSSGFTGVTITDSLDGTAGARPLDPRRCLRAAKAGTDMILLTGSEASTRGVFATLLSPGRRRGG